MSRFNQLFGKQNTDPNVEFGLKLIRQLKSELEPLNALSMEVIKGVVNGGETMKSYLNFSTKEQKHEPWFWVQCEYMYFFLHLVNRIALNKLGAEKRKLIHDRMVTTLLDSFVQSLCDFLSEDEQNELIGEIYTQLMAAELEYAQCSELIAKDDPFETKYLFSVLASKLTAISNNKGDPIKFVEILAMSFNTYQELSLTPLVVRLGAVIQEYPSKKNE